MEPELDKTELSLFSLMRDGVITGIAVAEGDGCWVVQGKLPLTTTTDNRFAFTSKISALDAYMKAYAHISTLRLEGKEIYTPEVKRKRCRMGL